LKSSFQVGVSFAGVDVALSSALCLSGQETWQLIVLGEILVWQLMKTIKAIQIIAAGLLPFR